MLNYGKSAENIGCFAPSGRPGASWATGLKHWTGAEKAPTVARPGWGGLHQWWRRLYTRHQATVTLVTLVTGVPADKFGANNGETFKLLCISRITLAGEHGKLNFCGKISEQISPCLCPCLSTIASAAQASLSHQQVWRLGKKVEALTGSLKKPLDGPKGPAAFSLQVLAIQGKGISFNSKLYPL
jgi:hypothetical protein